MALAQKFQFDTSFDHYRPGGEPVPEQRFSAAELDLARRQAWAEGRDAGEAEARSALAQRLTEATERLAMLFEALAADDALATERAERRAAELTLEALRRLHPALSQRGGIDELQSVFDGVLSDAAGQPRLIVRTPGGLADEVAALVQDAVARSAFDGRVSVVVDPTLGPGDFRIEWPDGGVERDAARLLARLDAQITDFIADFDRRRHATQTP